MQFLSWRNAFFVTMILLFATNIFWLLALVDAGTRETYREVACAELQGNSAVLAEIAFPKSSTFSQADIVSLLRQALPQAYIKSDSDGVRLGTDEPQASLTFGFSKERLSEISSIDGVLWSAQGK